MGKPAVIAVDIGTSSVRAALYAADGEARGLAQTHYGVLRPAPFMEEQDPDEVRVLVYDTIAACLAKCGACRADIRGLAFSSQMYSVFPVDASGKPLHNSVLWSDGRAEDAARAVRGRGLADALYRATGCPVNSLYPLAKLVWFRENRPDLFEKAARFVSIKDYVLQPLVGDWVADYSMSSGTGMLDLVGEKWSDLALEATGLDAGRLPRLVSGAGPLPLRADGPAAKWGLPESLPVFPGGGDGPLANIGSGASRAGGVNIDLGTSGALRVAVERPTFDPGGRLWCFAMFPGRWAFGGIVTNVGNAMQWLGTNLAYRDANLSPDAAAARIGDLAAGVPAGSDGVLCLPYFRKVRSPHWDDRLRGTLFGLTAGHDIRHVARAALEAVACDLARILDITALQSPISRPIVLTGGLSRNGLVPQLLADTLETPVETPAHCEGSLAGAAIIGLHGAGLVDGYSFLREAPAAGMVYAPRGEEAGIYRSLRSRYARAVEFARNFDTPEGDPS